MPNIVDKLKKRFAFLGDDVKDEDGAIQAIEAKVNAAPTVAAYPNEVLTALGFDEGATPTAEEVTAKVNALKPPAVEDPPVVDPPKISSAPVPKEVLDRIANIEGQLTLEKRDALVNSALRGGKILPAEREAAEKLALKDPALFQEMMAARPSHNLTQPLTIKTQAGGEVLLDADQAKVNSQLGIDAETYAKYYGVHGAVTRKEMEMDMAGQLPA